MKHFIWFKRKGSKNKEGLGTKGVSSISKSSRALLAPINLAIMLSVLLIGAVTIYSAPPTTKYLPGETLDPNCGPGDLNCSVELVSGGFTGVTSVDASGGSTGLSFSGGPITSGGTLTLSGTLGIGSGGTGATTASGALANLGGVPTDRLISTGVGLTGGGSLAADRTLAVVFGMTEGTVAEGNDSRIINGQAAYTWGNHADAGYLTAFSETDPSVPSHVKSIAITDIANWNTAFSWGNHADAGYLTGFTEADPTVPVHVKGITSGQLTNWDNAFSWGDHSLVGYLKDFTELDPTVPTHVKNITSSNITNWNTAFSWGNHATAGYLTASAIDTSAKLAAIVGDETGTGALVFNTNPSFTGNVRLAASSYLNWGGVSGVGGYGIRDNNGVMEFKDEGGNWVAFNSLSGGAGESLWSLHGNGLDIFRNGGNVGINTMNPIARFESVSSTIAAWFRGDMAVGDSIATVTNTGRHTIEEDSCLVFSGHFSPDGSMLFLLNLCMGETEEDPPSVFVERHDLDTAWDVNTAEFANASPVLSSQPMFDVTFSSDGSTMYVLSPIMGEPEEEMAVQIYQYDLISPWNISTDIGSPSITEIGAGSVFVGENGDIQLSADGTKLFLSALYDNSGEMTESLLVYELDTPHDTTSVQGSHSDMLPFGGGGMQKFAFNQSGDKLFGLLPGLEGGTVDILEVTFDQAWDISLENMINDQIHEGIDTNGLDVPFGYMYSDFILNASGTGFYLTYTPLDLINDVGGISQYTNPPEKQGGTVLVDGNVGIGVEGPTARLESMSKTIAGWFRGVSKEDFTPWDFSDARRDGDLVVGPLREYDSECDVGGAAFNGDGTKVFLSGHCYNFDHMSVHEYDLSVPWDINSAVDNGVSFDPWPEIGLHPIDIEFSADGHTMYMLTRATQNPSYPNNPGARLYEYSLVEPWSMASGNLTMQRYIDLGDDVEAAYNFQFTNGGSKLFVAGWYDDYDETYGRFWSYDLSSPYDIGVSSIDVGNPEMLDFPGFPFAFSPSGEEFFFLFVEEFGAASLPGGGDTESLLEKKLEEDFGGNFAIMASGSASEGPKLYLVRISLDTPWDLDFISEPLEYSYNIPNTTGDEYYTDLLLKPDGSKYYLTYSGMYLGDGITTGGLYQYSIGGFEGGHVLVDGNLGVGTTSPTSKLTVVGDSEFDGDVTIYGNLNVRNFRIGDDPNRQMVFDPEIAAFRIGTPGWDEEDYGRGDYSLAFGDYISAVGEHSLAYGYYASAMGDYSFAGGEQSYADGNHSFAFGRNVNAPGNYSVAFGRNVGAPGNYSFVSGYYATASGTNTTAFGYYTTAQSYLSTVLGRYNVIQGNTGSWVATDQLFVIGNGLSDWNRSNALTVLKNGNVGIGDSAYLNFGASDGVSIGETGYGFRDNAGVMEYKDLGGNWTALNSLGGEGGSIDAPLEVTSGSLAAWFRGTQSVTPWNVAQLEEDTFYEMAPAGTSYYIGGGKFSSNGKKLFTIEDDGAEQSVVEYTLSTPWHISTGDSGTPYNFVNSITDPIVDIAFSDDGTMFYALSSDFTNGVYVHQYTLSAPWNVSAPIFDKTEELVVSSGTLAGATGIRFSADGSDLFMFAQMLNTTPPNIPQAFGHIVRYSLGTAWDVATATEMANENFSSDVAPEFSSAMLFDFSTDGSKLFVGVADVDVLEGTFNIVMKEYLLDTPWDITNRTAGVSKVFESGTGDPLDPLTGATPYRSFVFRPNGLAAYAVQQATTGFAGGVTQFVLKKNDSGGGDVHIDGDLAVGNVNPAFKLHVTASGSDMVAGFTNDNGTCVVDPNTSSLVCSSDRDLKTEVLSIRELGDEQTSLGRLMLLDPVSYRWNSEAGTDGPLRYGLIAQDVQNIFPELVSTNPLDGTLAVSYGGFTPFMIDAIQELSDKIDTKVFEVAVGGVEGETLGGSLVDIITRALRNAVLTVKELVTDTLRTKEICIEDEDGATCIDRKDLDELLGNKETVGDRKSEHRDADESNIPGETNEGEGKVEDEDEEPAPEDPEEGAKEDEGETPAEGDDTNNTDLEGDTDPDTEPEDGGGALDDGDLVEGGDSDEGNSEGDN